MRYVGLGLAVCLQFVIVACGDSGSTRVQVPQPPVDTLPPGIPGVAIGNKTLSGSTPVTINSDLPFLPDFGPEQVTIEVVVSAVIDPLSDDKVHIVSATPLVVNDAGPTFPLLVTNIDGELTFDLDLSAICGDTLELVIDGSVNPADTWNFAGGTVERSCQGGTVSIDFDEFELTEVL